jgi:hypothetical protein
MVTRQIAFLSSCLVFFWGQFSSLKADEIEVWCSYTEGSRTLTVGLICEGPNNATTCQACKDALQAMYPGKNLTCGNCSDVVARKSDVKLVTYSQFQPTYQPTYRPTNRPTSPTNAVFVYSAGRVSSVLMSSKIS